LPVRNYYAGAEFTAGDRIFLQLGDAKFTASTLYETTVAGDPVPVLTSPGVLLNVVELQSAR